jgi:hypothetical protein
MKFKFSALVISLTALFVLSSCGSGGNKGEDKEKSAFDSQTLEEDITHLVSEDFPKPSEIPYLIMQTGADYNETLLNARTNVDNYSEPDDAGLNLGVYAADMGYLASYDKTQQAIDYFAACKRLADDLGILDGFGQEMADSVDANIGNKDKLTKLLDSAVGQASKYMVEGKSKIGALIITGSFVESLYLATGIVNTYAKDAFADKKQSMLALTPLIQMVIHQDKSVKEVSTMLGKVDQTPRVTSLLQDWKALESAYEALAPLKEKIAAGKKDLTFDDKTLAGISAAVEKIRSDITQ